MADIAVHSRSHCVVLDAGALIALERGDSDTRAAIAWALQKRYQVVVPTPVIAQVHRGGRDRAGLDRVLNAVDWLVPTTAAVARQAGELLGRAGTNDAVDAIVAAEALRAAPAMLITSDPDDLSRLTVNEPEGGRILV